MKWKVLKKYFHLWILDRLADQVGSEPLRVKKIFDSFYFLIKLFVGVWAFVVGLLCTTNGTDITESTKLFVSIAFSKDLHFGDFGIHAWVVVFWIISAIWVFFFIISVIIEDRSASEKIEMLSALILRAPGRSRLYKNYKSIFDKAFDVFRELGAITKEFSGSDFKRVEEFEVGLIAINTLLIRVARQFFNNEMIVGANLMIFFKGKSDSSLIQKLLRGSKSLYFRQQGDLEGVLVLIPELISSSDRIDRKIPPLVLPVYRNSAEVYGVADSDDGIIPGATLAFRDGTSMVGDTGNIGKYYSKFSADLQAEVKAFFSDYGKHVRSFASFRIPESTEEETFPIGVLNLDSDISYSFGLDEEFFPTFYALIYPILKLLSEHLYEFRHYKTDTLAGS